MDVSLKVNQAYPGDSGRGIVRLDPDAMFVDLEELAYFGADIEAICREA
jgi:SpoVK/Ycf46/Vps4 family AAA+-type ATPase